MSIPMLTETPHSISPPQPTRFGNYSVIFQIEQQRYALPLTNVERALRMVAITPVVEFPAWMPGVIDLHGEVIPVVDIGQRFNFPRREIRPEAQLLIVRANDQSLALIADNVSEVLELPVQEMAVPAEIKRELQLVEAVIRWEGQLILVLKADRLLDPLPGPIDIASLDEIPQLTREDQSAVPDGLVEKSSNANFETGETEHIQLADETPSPADDLTQIKGIGPVSAARLAEGSIHTFQQLADQSVEQIQNLLDFPAGRTAQIVSWLEQAQQLKGIVGARNTNE